MTRVLACALASLLAVVACLPACSYPDLEYSPPLDDAGLHDGDAFDFVDVPDSPVDSPVDVPSDVPPADVPDVAVPCTEAVSGVFGGHCYFFLDSKGSWSAARDACAALSVPDHKVHLVTITTGAEYDFVVTLPTTDGFGRWIGLASSSPSTKPTDFKWITGESGSAGRWVPGTPNAVGTCVVLHSSTFTPPNLWEDSGCAGPYFAVCERE